MCITLTHPMDALPGDSKAGEHSIVTTLGNAPWALTHLSQPFLPVLQFDMD
jgi:hypothetical protein